jgi:hypothetical protein
METDPVSSNTTNPFLRTYGDRPVPFQFRDSEEKLYIGSKVNRFC